MSPPLGQPPGLLGYTRQTQCLPPFVKSGWVSHLLFILCQLLMVFLPDTCKHPNILISCPLLTPFLSGLPTISFILMAVRLRVVGGWPGSKSIVQLERKQGHQDSHPHFSSAKDCSSSLPCAAFLALNIPTVSYNWGQSILQSLVDFSNRRGKW